MADVSFTKKTWADGSSGGTPITAAELNRMEQGIKDCADGVNELGDSISPVFVAASSNRVSVLGNQASTVSISPQAPLGYIVAAFRDIETDHPGTFAITGWKSGGGSVAVSVKNLYPDAHDCIVTIECMCVKES